MPSPRYVYALSGQLLLGLLFERQIHKGLDLVFSDFQRAANACGSGSRVLKPRSFILLLNSSALVAFFKAAARTDTASSGVPAGADIPTGSLR